jgi:para-nitrobenzyl esterase
MRKIVQRVMVAFTLCVVACGDGTTTGGSPADADATADARGDGEVPNEAGVEGGAGCPREDNFLEVTGGCIHGATAGSIHTFFGVPFAAPPTNERRWRAPADPIPWTGVREAVAFSKACPQIAPLLAGKTLDWDEDCLYLNIWTPSLDATAKLPVMVWIHGGGLVNGSGVESIYSGKYISEKGQVVAVTVNYRLGQLGYLGHPALAVEQNGRSGNYGLLDQIRALQWVQANVAQFGGDPGNVTVYGESAGALSTCALLASPRADGLFHRAVMESGGCPGYGTYVRPEKTAMGVEGAEEQGVRYATALGCGNDGDTLACMRAKSPGDVLSTLPAVSGVLSQGERYGFTVDGDALSETPEASTSSGAFHHVPTLLGTNADEGTIFVASIAVPTDAAYGAYVHGIFPGAKGDAVLAQYPSASFVSPKAALAALVTDAIFACPARRKARDIAMYSPVYLYQFTTIPSYARALGLGAFHGSEIDFVLGTLRDRASGSPTAEELALSDAMLGYWSRFAKAGDPNGGAIIWPKYDAVGDSNLELATPSAPMTGLKMQKCDFWDAL